jgi:hypothetical protein
MRRPPARSILSCTRDSMKRSSIVIGPNPSTWTNREKRPTVLIFGRHGDSPFTFPTASSNGICSGINPRRGGTFGGDVTVTSLSARRRRMRV